MDFIDGWMTKFSTMKGGRGKQKERERKRGNENKPIYKRGK